MKMLLKTLYSGLIIAGSTSCTLQNSLVNAAIDSLKYQKDSIYFNYNSPKKFAEKYPNFIDDKESVNNGFFARFKKIITTITDSCGFTKTSYLPLMRASFPSYSSIVEKHYDSINILNESTPEILELSLPSLGDVTLSQLALDKEGVQKKDFLDLLLSAYLLESKAYEALLDFLKDNQQYIPQTWKEQFICIQPNSNTDDLLEKKVFDYYPKLKQVKQKLYEIQGVSAQLVDNNKNPKDCSTGLICAEKTEAQGLPVQMQVDKNYELVENHDNVAMHCPTGLICDVIVIVSSSDTFEKNLTECGNMQAVLSDDRTKATLGLKSLITPEVVCFAGSECTLLFLINRVVRLKSKYIKWVIKRFPRYIKSLESFMVSRKQDFDQGLLAKEEYSAFQQYWQKVLDDYKSSLAAAQSSWKISNTIFQYAAYGVVIGFAGLFFLIDGNNIKKKISNWWNAYSPNNDIRVRIATIQKQLSTKKYSIYLKSASNKK